MRSNSSPPVALSKMPRLANSSGLRSVADLIHTAQIQGKTCLCRRDWSALD